MPRISGPSLQQHREQLHRRVVDAFAELMTERSFDAITMAAIAERAEISRTSIYHHFPDKESVVVAFASHETARYVDGLREVLARASGPVERLRVYVRHQLEERPRFHMGLGPQLYGAVGARSRPRIREHVAAVEEVLREIVHDGMSSGDFTVEDPDATLALIHGCLVPRRLPVAAVETFVLRAVCATA